MNTAYDEAELDELIDAWLDGDSEVRDQLNAILQRNTAARQRLMMRSQLAADLGLLTPHMHVPPTNLRQGRGLISMKAASRALIALNRD